MYAKELKRTLLTAISNNLPVLVKGAPGVGKSDIVAQVAAELEMDLLVSHPVVSDPTDFKGLPGIVDGKAEFLPFGDLRKLVETKKPTIAFLDDLGQAPACVQAAAMQLILARRVNGHKVSDKVVFVAATNRREDRAGVTGILEPVKSRFATILELEVSMEEWVEWALNNDVPAELIGFVYYRPELLTKGAATADIVNHPCPRTITFAGKLIQAGLKSIEVLAGAIGEAAAVELVGFLKIHDSLPDIDGILKEPQKAPIPSDPATMYAVVSALIHKSTEQNAEKILQYATRMDSDFSVLLLRDMLRKNPKCAKNKGLIEWIAAHKDVLM